MIIVYQVNDGNDNLVQNKPTVNNIVTGTFDRQQLIYCLSACYIILLVDMKMPSILSCIKLKHRKRWSSFQGKVFSFEEIEIKRKNLRLSSNKLYTL